MSVTEIVASGMTALGVIYINRSVKTLCNSYLNKQCNQKTRWEKK